MLHIVNDIQMTVTSNYYSEDYSLMLKKAFDIVDNDILLDKVNHYGFRGIIDDWFSPYHIKLPLDVVFLKDQFLVLCFSCRYTSMISTDARINLGFTSLHTTPTFCMRTKI